MLIDPSISALTAAGLPGSLLSFGMPCLKWKLIAGFKTHWGFNGFDTTIAPPNKYLTQTVNFSLTFNYTSGGSQSVNQTFAQTLDRISGAVIAQTGDNIDPPIGAFTKNTTGDAHQTWTQGPFPVGSGITQTNVWDVTLSEPYTMPQLEADVDTLLNGIDPATMSNQSLLPVAYDQDNEPRGGQEAMSLIPSPYGYPALTFDNFPFDASMPQPALGAAALAAYNPNLFVADFGLSGMVKLVGYLAMAGDYSLVTHYTDANGVPIPNLQTGVSGRGSCSQWFKVTPPTPFVYGRNSYVVAVPNSQYPGSGI